MPAPPDIRTAVAAAYLSTFLAHIGSEVFDFLLPGSVSTRPGTLADRTLAEGGVRAADMTIVVEARVRGGHWSDFERTLPATFNLLGQGRAGETRLYACAVPPQAVRDQEGVPQVFTLIARPA
jgi:hypothetical protein